VKDSILFRSLLQQQLYFSVIRTMAVHTIHIFDRKGKTLFTKRYYPTATNDNDNSNTDSEQLSEQRKLVFGMVYSLREITKMLTPITNNSSSTDTDTGLHSVQTGASTLHTYETNSGLRLCLYTTNHTVVGTNNVVDTNNYNTTTSSNAKSIRHALQYIYHELWIQCVTRSPMYTPTSPNVIETNFETNLDTYLKAQPWFA
jgi:trafficking protein particle complex subunit 1